MLEFVIFWVVVSSSVMVEYQLFGGLCCLHLQEDEGRTISVFITMKTYNLA